MFDLMSDDIGGKDVSLMLVDSRSLDVEPDSFLDEFKFYFPRIPCVLIIDKNSPALTEYYKNMGFEDCISVSVRRTSLVNSIHQCLGNRQHLIVNDPEQNLISELDPDIPFRILLAEDSMANQLVAINVLQGAGYSVDAVANGLEAIKAVQSIPYDVVLMDLQMPEMGGIEATYHIRRLPGRMGNVPVMAMTANVLSDVKAECKQVGMNDFISKPVVKAELFSKLQKLYDKKKAILSGSERESETVVLFESSASESSSADCDQTVVNNEVLEELVRDTSIDAVRRMFAVFITETNTRIDNMSLLISNQDWLALKSEAHTLKSSAASYGAAELSELALDIESTIKDQGDMPDFSASDLSDLAAKSISRLQELLSNMEAGNP